MVEIRQIRADEWHLLKEVRLAALEDSPEAFSTKWEEAVEKPDDYWKERTRNGAGGEIEFCVLAIDDDEPVGMAIGWPDKDDALVIYLISMWVAPSHRGSQVAASLLNKIFEWAADRGASSILAGVMPANSRALAFYTKLGFAQVSEPDSDHPAVTGCELVLEKKLEDKK